MRDASSVSLPGWSVSFFLAVRRIHFVPWNATGGDRGLDAQQDEPLAVDRDRKSMRGSSRRA